MEEKLERALEFSKSQHNTGDFIFAYETADTEFDYRNVVIQQNIYENMSEIVTKQLKKRVRELESSKKELKRYDITYISSNKTPIQYIDSGDFDGYSKIREVVEDHNFENMDGDTKPAFQVIRLSNEDNKRLLAFKNFTGHQIVGKSKKTYLIKRGNEFDKFRNKLISLPTKIDAIWFEGTLFIFKQKAFNSSINYIEELRERSKEAIRNVEESGINFDDEDLFEEAVLDDRRKSIKINEILDYGIANEIDMDDAEEIIGEFDLDLEVVAENGTKQIKLPDKNKVWEAIHLLNNDHLVSPVNEDKFQVERKEKR